MPKANGIMDFHTYTTTRDACNKAGDDDGPRAFYETVLAGALAMQSAQFFFQLNNERDFEQARRPYYNVWPSIVPMLTRLDLDLDSALIQLPLPALCVRLPKQHNPLTFEWRRKPFQIRSMLMGEMGDVYVLEACEPDAVAAENRRRVQNVHQRRTHDAQPQAASQTRWMERRSQGSQENLQCLDSAP